MGTEWDLVEWGRFGYKVESKKGFLEGRLVWTNVRSRDVKGVNPEHNKNIGQGALNDKTVHEEQKIVRRYLKVMLIFLDFIL